MNRESKELWAFLRAIEKNPYDVTTRKVFADWLDERDEPEEANKKRSFSVRKQQAVDYVKRFCFQYGADYDDLVKSVAAGDGYCFGSDYGQEAAREDGELFESVAVIVEVPADEIQKDQRFRCAC